MIIQLPESIHFLQYATPPVVGALIGYLTNKIAIRMLFRPLKKWHLFSIPLPMTPGVIPSKRHQLAENIGAMVGEHLLTSEEIKRSLERQSFQNHLAQLLEKKLVNSLEKERGPLAQLIGEDITPAFRKIQENMTNLIVQQLLAVLHNERTREILENRFEEVVLQWQESTIDDIVNLSDREHYYQKITSLLQVIAAREETKTALSATLASCINRVFSEKKSLKDILSPVLLEDIALLIEKKTPEILLYCAQLLRDPAVREMIVHSIKGGIDSFIDSLGALGGMVRGFVDMQKLEGILSAHLEKKEEDIEQWLTSEEMCARIVPLLREKVEQMYTTPLCDLIKDKSAEEIARISTDISSFLLQILQKDETLAALALMLRDAMEQYLQKGQKTVSALLEDCLSTEQQHTLRATVRKLPLRFFSGEKSILLVTRIVTNGLQLVTSQPIGRLSRFIPASLSMTISQKMTRSAVGMLGADMQEILKSFDIQHIIADKIDRLDLLKLEDLLLSIMKEQFAAINIFGAVIGFIIGCMNALFLTVF